MMKKIALLLASVLCALACVFALTGCNDITDNTGSSDTGTNTDTGSADTETDTSTDTKTDTDIPADTESETKADETTDAPHTVHTYGDWQTIKEPTCKDVGMKIHTCTVCNHTELGEIPKIFI